MKYIFIYLLFFLLELAILSAENSMSGRVFNKATKEPLFGATLFIPELKVRAVSDSKGIFLFKSLPKGTYLVLSQFISYKTLVQSVEVKGVTTIDFEMDESSVQKNEIIVTGQSEASELSASPLPVVVINSDFLKTNSSTNVIDAIASTPGVSAVTTGPNVSKPFIRGLGFNRILTLLDGSRQEGQQWGDEHGIEIDQYSVDHVELIKGPSSLVYGSDALAGVVNLISGKPAPEGKFIGGALMEYQSNNGLIGSSAMLSQTIESFNWSFRLSHKSATNYQNKIDGRVFGTKFSETNANGSAGIVRNWGMSTLHFSIYNNMQEIPDGSRDSITRKFTKQITEDDEIREIVPDNELNSYSIDGLHQFIEHYRVCSDNTFYFENSHIDLTISYQRSVRREFNHPRLLEIPGLYLKLNTLCFNLNYTYPKFYDWNITAGTNGMYQSNDVTSGTEFIIPGYRQLDFGTFITFNRNFGNFSLSAGVRYDIRDFSYNKLYVKHNPITGFDMVLSGTDTIGATQIFPDYSKLFSGFTGSIGATYKFDDNLNFKINISRGYRAPNIAEISANGVHPGTNIYQLSNPDFSPEFNLQEDFAVEYNSKYIDFSIAAFNNNISNYIYNQKLTNYLGGDSIIISGNQTFQFKASTARLYGGELMLEIKPIDALSFNANISLVFGDNSGAAEISSNDSTKYLPAIMPVHGNFDAKIYIYKEDVQHLADVGHLNSIFVKAGIEYYLKQDRVYLADNTETPTPGYVLVNIGIGGSYVNSNGEPIISCYLFCNNLLDKAYQNHLSRLKYFEPYQGNFTGHNGIYGMGRNINIKIEAFLN
ncbi:MAG: TonB-dependent receptor [Ignavibacteria bacterium]|nr:TonB-dependent receptor [Ignavibacteria bacterium]